MKYERSQHYKLGTSSARLLHQRNSGLEATYIYMASSKGDRKESPQGHWLSPSKYCNQSNRCHSQKPLFVMKWILNFSQVRRFHYSQCMKIPSIFLQQQLCPVTKIKNFCLSTWSTVNWQVRKQIIHICNMRNIKERGRAHQAAAHI